MPGEPGITTSAMTQSVSTTPTAPSATTAPVVIEHLTKVFPPQLGQKAKVGVNDLTLTVERGQTFGLLGANGAGKTTTQKILLGLTRATRGTVRIFGEPPEDPKVRERIGYLPENPYFYTYLTGREFLRFCGELFDLPRATLKERVPELLSLVGMTHAADLQLRKYSKGMLQRIGIAQALVNDPELVFLDEPMTGLDPVGRREFRDIIKQLKAQGKTLFFNSHILSDVEELCCRVGILHQGTLVAEGRVKDLIPANGTLEDYYLEVVRAHA